MSVTNKFYLNLLYGFLLGKTFILRTKKEIKLVIKIEDKHISYMKFIHKKFYNLGLCSQNLPKINTKLVKKGKLRKIMVLHTYNNNDYLNLYNKWYLDKNKKIIPYDFEFYFNEESLAFWLMTEGSISNKNLYVNIKQFNSTDIKFLISFLENRFKLEKINLINDLLEFNSDNILKINKIIKPYIFPSMQFKFMV